MNAILFSLLLAASPDQAPRAPQAPHTYRKYDGAPVVDRKTGKLKQTDPTRPWYPDGHETPNPFPQPGTKRSSDFFAPDLPRYYRPRIRRGGGGC